MTRNYDENRYIGPDSHGKNCYGRAKRAGSRASRKLGGITGLACALTSIAVMVAVTVIPASRVLAGPDVARIEADPEALVWHNAETGLAISGFDPVSYHGPGGPRRGVKEFERRVAGGVWRFANKGNVEAFAASPATYLPRYGGYGAYSMALGLAVEPNPRIWHIYQGRLYLFHSLKAKTAWLKNASNLKTLADDQWRGLETRFKSRARKARPDDGRSARPQAKLAK